MHTPLLIEFFRLSWLSRLHPLKMDPLSIATTRGAAFDAAGTVAWKFEQFIDSTNMLACTIGETKRETRMIPIP